MSGLFFLFIAVILCTVIVYIRIHSKRTMLTYALIGLIVSQALWQAYIAVLYAVDILSMETAETLFRLFRIGALATPTFFFLILVETLHHAQEDMGWLNRLFTRRHAFLYGVMTIGLYGLIGRSTVCGRSCSSNAGRSRIFIRYRVRSVC